MYQRPSFQNNSYGSSQGNPGDSPGGRGGRGGRGGGRGSRGGGGRGRGRGFTPERLTQVNFDYQKISTSPALGGNGHHNPNTFPQRPYEHHNSYNNSNNLRPGPTHQTSQPPRRGYPPRAPYGRSSPAENGQGFNSGNASAYVPPHLRNKVAPTPTFSAPITPRGPSNPRFLIPIKFVKGTGADEQAVKKLEEAQTRVRKAPVVTDQVQNTPPQPVLQDHTPVVVDKIEPENHASTEMHIDPQQELVPSPSVESIGRPGLDPIDQLAQNSLLAVADPSSLTLNSSTDMSKTNDQTIEQPEPSTPLPKVLPVNTSLEISPTHPSTPSELPADVLAPSQTTKTMIDVSAPLETQTPDDPAVLIASLKVSEPPTSTQTQTEPSASASDTSLAIPFADPKPAEKESLTFVVDCEGDPNLVSNLPPLAPRTKTFYQPLHEPVVAPTLAMAEKPTGVRPSESGWTSSGQPVSVSHLSRSILDPVVAPEAPVPQPMADVIPSSESTGKARKGRKAIREQRRIRSERDERVRITSLESGGPGPGQVPREGDSDIEWGSDGPPGEQLSEPKKEAMKKQRSRKEQEEMAILQDYVQNTASLSDSDEETGGEGVGAEADAKRMRSFLNSVSESGSKHKTIDELEDDDVMAEEAEHLAKGGWKSDSDDSEDSFDEYGLDYGDEDEVDDDGKSQKSTSTVVMEEILKEVEENDSIELSSDSDHSHHSDFEGSDVSLGQTLASENLTSTGIPKEVEDDMKDVEIESDDEDSEDEEEMLAVERTIWGLDPKAARQAAKRAKKGKGKLKAKLQTGDSVIDALQVQWQADRKAKAERKAARELARLTGELGNAKKSKKKAASRRERFEGDMLLNIHSMMRYFIEHALNDTQLLLPAVNKKMRAKIHLAAHAYGLKSYSSGKGKHRAPTLERTHATRVWGVDLRKVQSILFGPAPPRSTQEHTDWQRDYRLRGTHGNNREGTLVGQGASELGQENAGFKLLAKMGWTQGETMGSISSTNGLQAPLMAVVKNTKSGLGVANQIRTYGPPTFFPSDLQYNAS